ncbi:hypothetical protein KIW84_061024 [Lathyrus oleraceus]|uniref:Uncharacterized protein n=1 Tax=Pisum sativum TaxID=3888 RepID=A0A9D4W4A3_PEA|nr:hypothetical protein KIW84_061024 [Pisum sativum]
MWPEGDPTGAATQRILFWQHKTMEMMYKTIYNTLVEVGLEAVFSPQDYLNFFCLGNREAVDMHETHPITTNILHERGIVNFKFKEFNSAVEDLSACVQLDRDNKSAYTYLGLALSSIGEYKKVEEAYLKSLQLDRSFLEAWGHLAQFYQDLSNPTKAFECLTEVLQIDGRFARAYHLRGLLFHAMGEHRKAIKDLTMGLNIDGANIESLYLRAACYHAVGQYKEAVKDYDAALDLELDSMDKFVLQCLAFYQKEIALYTTSQICSCHFIGYNRVSSYWSQFPSFKF